MNRKPGVKRRILLIKSFQKSKRIGTLLTIIIAAIVLTSLTGCIRTTNATPANTVSSDHTVGTASPGAPEKPSDDTAGTNDPPYSNSTKQEEAESRRTISEMILVNSVILC